MQIANLIKPSISRRFTLDPSLRLYLPLYQLDGQRFMSKDAYGHLATVTGATWNWQGRTFDGTDDYISVPANSTLNFGGTAFSCGFWLNPTTLVDNEGLLAQRKNGGPHNWQLLEKANGDLFFSFWVATVEKTASSTATALVTGTWSHVFITYNGSVVTFYHNGSQLGNTVALTGTMDSGSVATIVSAYFPTAGYQAGLVGEVYIYSRTLSAFEIQDNYLKTKRGYQ